MELLKYAIHLFMHLDTYLGAIIKDYGLWTHALLFMVIFCETGFVVTPFLPGDSLLFASGAFAALGSLNLTGLAVSLSFAAVAGDNLNYLIGHTLGPKVFSAGSSRWLNRKHLDQTHRFYEKHGGKTVILARFVPIVRTFTPFVAGIGSMTYGRFLAYDIGGGLAWILIFTLGGYFFGNIPLVRRNFTMVIFAIILVSVAPAVIAYGRQKWSTKQGRPMDDGRASLRD